MKKNTFNVVIAAILFVVTLPLFLLIYPFQFVVRRKHERKFKTFILENEDKNYFCYNNRENSMHYIENNILPQLGECIEIVFLNGKIVESNQNSADIAYMLINLNKYHKFPHLIKIRKGQIVEKSINNIFYNVLNDNQAQDELLSRINQFFHKD